MRVARSLTAALAVALCAPWTAGACRRSAPPAPAVARLPSPAPPSPAPPADPAPAPTAADGERSASGPFPAPAAEPADDPRVVAVVPPNGAVDVDPGLTELRVTFDRSMDPEGWAWVVEHPMTAPRIGESSWDASARTSTARVALEPGHDYVVWVNSPQYSYFRDRGGRAATPFRWTFSTRGPKRGGPSTGWAWPHSGAPRVVALVPADRAMEVDPGVAELRVTFDRKMDPGWSWVAESAETFPSMTGESRMEPDGRTIVLPVRLEPGRDYVVWLNSPAHQGFHDAAGVPLHPTRWTFRTKR